MNNEIKRICKKYRLTEHEVQTIYTRYCKQSNLKVPANLSFFEMLCKCYADTGIRWLLHEPENFDFETDRG